MSDLAALRHANFLDWMTANGLNANKVATATGVPYTTIKSYADRATTSLRGDTEARIAAAFRIPIEEIFGAPELSEEYREPNYIGAWRAFAGLTVEQVAAALGFAPQIILQLEAGEIDLTAKLMMRLAPVFGTQPGHLLISPEDAQADIVAVASSVPKDQQAQALRVLRTFTGTDG